MEYKASVVIPNLNGAGWLRDSIESVFAQTEPALELIVVDNGSTDESLAIARSYCGRANYTLIENGANTGFSHAANQGIAAAKAPYVVLFNNDAFAEADWLMHLLAAADADPRAFSVQGLMLRHYQRELADDAGDYMTVVGWACKRGDGLPAARYQRPGRIFSACGGASLYRRSMLQEIGGFDENFFAYLEDVDLGWRANAHGWRNLYCPAARCYHICGATTGGAQGAKYNDFKARQSGRNNLLLPCKNMPLLMLVCNLPFLVPGYLVKWLFFTLHGFGRAWRQGMREAWALRGRLQRPRFRWRDVPHHLLLEGWMILNCFVYVDYRVRRALRRT